MNAPYDQASEPAYDRLLPRRDWGAYALLAAYLLAIGATEGVLVVRLLQLIGVMS